MPETAKSSRRPHSPAKVPAGSLHSRVDDEPVGDVDQPFELGAPQGELAAPAEKHGQVGDEQGWTMLAERARARRRGAA